MTLKSFAATALLLAVTVAVTTQAHATEPSPANATPVISSIPSVNAAQDAEAKLKTETSADTKSKDVSVGASANTSTDTTINSSPAPSLNVNTTTDGSMNTTTGLSK
jgi:hypothetical protein